MNPAHAATSPQSGPLLLFVVDDEPDICSILSITLKSAGFAVKTFGDPLAAADAFDDAQPKPAAVITDFTMPGMNGIDLIAHCRATVPGLPAVLFSGLVTPETLALAPVRPDVFIRKPFLPQKFAEEVKALLECQDQTR
jgi:DNA-binding NtrC family response regulator